MKLAESCVLIVVLRVTPVVDQAVVLVDAAICSYMLHGRCIDDVGHVSGPLIHLYLCFPQPLQLLLVITSQCPNGSRSGDHIKFLNYPFFAIRDNLVFVTVFTTFAPLEAHPRRLLLLKASLADSLFLELHSHGLFSLCDFALSCCDLLFLDSYFRAVLLALLFLIQFILRCFILELSVVVVCFNPLLLPTLSVPGLLIFSLRELGHVATMAILIGKICSSVLILLFLNLRGRFKLIKHQRGPFIIIPMLILLIWSLLWRRKVPCLCFLLLLAPNLLFFSLYQVFCAIRRKFKWVNLTSKEAK